MRVSAVVILVSIAQALTGCGGSSPRSIAAPSPVGQTIPPVPAAPQMLSGYVGDTGFRPVAGARIDVLDGQQAGTVLISDADGHFSYPNFAGSANLRATKEGYATAVSATIAGTDRIYVIFDLAPLAPPVRVAGNYTLTIEADGACTGLPDAVRTRTYQATVTAVTNGRAPANTMFNGSATGGSFVPFANIFWVGVAGDYVAVSTQGEGPSLIEQVGPNAYVAYYGEAAATIPTPEPSTISAPFRGSIEYCELKTPFAQYYDCSPALAGVREECTSTSGRLTLTRR
jgi:hypothetical protein